MDENDVIFGVTQVSKRLLTMQMAAKDKSSFKILRKFTAYL